MGSFFTFALLDYPTDTKLNNMTRVLNANMSNTFDKMMDFEID